jgi:hypothetical protein
MASPVKDISHATPAVDQATLEELREKVSTLAKELAAVAERRAKAAGEAVSDAAGAGVVELRRGIRRQPALAMGIAIAAGAVLALTVVPRFRQPRATNAWDRWTPNVTRADFYDLADNIQRSVSRAASAAAAPVAPAFERMVDAISRTDASSMSTVVEKLGGWFQKAQEKAKEKMR